jgi:flagellin-like hook-associated protein FlgL
MRNAGITDITVSDSGGRLKFDNIDQSKTLNNFSGPIARDILPSSVGGTLSYVDGGIRKDEGDPTYYGTSKGYVQGPRQLPEYTKIVAGENDTLTMNLNGANVTVKLTPGIYSRNALVAQLNSKLGGKATASLSSNYLRITNAREGNSVINVNLGNIGGNAVDSLFRTSMGTFSASGTPPTSGSAATAGYVYRSSGGTHEAETEITAPNNRVTFSFYNGSSYSIDLPPGTYTDTQIYNELVSIIEGNSTLNSLIKARSSFGFESKQTGYSNSFNITGAPADWMYRMMSGTQDGTSTDPVTGGAYANGRVDMSGEIEITEAKSDLTFDLVKDGVLTTHTVKLPVGTYQKPEDFIDALNDAFKAQGLPQMSGKLIDVRRPDGTHFTSMQLNYLPDSSGQYRLEGFRGAGSHVVFYDHPSKPNNLWLQVGAYSKDMYMTDIPILMTRRMLRQYTDVASQESANATIDMMDEAINYVSLKRAVAGAAFNVLSHTYEVRRIQEENITYAESHIRDADMAMEAMDFEAHRIMMQASNSMLKKAADMLTKTLDLMA